jgi:hypothetical protein
MFYNSTWLQLCLFYFVFQHIISTAPNRDFPDAGQHSPSKKKTKAEREDGKQTNFCVVLFAKDLVPTSRQAENPCRYWARARGGSELTGGERNFKNLITCVVVDKPVGNMLSNC